MCAVTSHSFFGSKQQRSATAPLDIPSCFCPRARAGWMAMLSMAFIRLISPFSTSESIRGKKVSSEDIPGELEAKVVALESLS